MIGKMIVATALLLAFPAQAHDPCAGKTYQMLRGAPSSYVKCVAKELDQLSEKDGPKAGESIQDINYRWEKAISAKCADPLMAPIPGMRAVCDDTVRIPIYLDVLTMTMQQVIFFRASDDYWKWQVHKKMKEVAEENKEN